MHEHRYGSVQELKNEVRTFGIRVSLLKSKKYAGKFKGIVALFPTKKYAKEYTYGDMDDAPRDLAHWYGLIGKILPDGSVVMNVRDEGDD